MLFSLHNGKKEIVADTNIVMLLMISGHKIDFIVSHEFIEVAVVVLRFDNILLFLFFFVLFLFLIFLVCFGSIITLHVPCNRWQKAIVIKRDKSVFVFAHVPDVGKVDSLWVRLPFEAKEV